MREFHTGKALLTIAALLAAPMVFAQKWEIGGGGGASFYTGKDIAGRNNAAGNFKPRGGFALTGVIGNNMYDYVGGEFRYTWQKNDLSLESGGTNVKFGARSSAFHYDVLIHTASVRQKVRPFVAVGAGVKLYEGTGREVVAQPLSNLAFLTKTRELKPLITFGGGVKVQVSEKMLFRAEVKDYFSQVPTKVAAPAPGASLGGWFHNFVFLVGVSALF
jgi:hypothetical protein